MADGFHFYSRIFTELTNALNGYVGDTVTLVIDAITPVATTLLVLYVIFWGWAMMRGSINEPITDGATRVIKLAVITAIALNLGHYNTFLADWLWNSPDAMASFVGGGDGSGNAAYLDQLWTKIYDFGNVFYAYATANRSALTGMPDMSGMAAAWAIWLAGMLATGYGAFLLVLSKMALAVILGIGPIFVLLLMFEATKRFFDAWMGQALNYVFLVILAAAALKLMFAILETYLTDVSTVSGNPSLEQAIPAIALAVIGTLVLVQTPTIASAIAGGVAIGTLNAVAWGYSKMRGAAGGARDLATGKTLSNMRAARRQRTNNARWAKRNPSVPMAVYRKITNSRK